ncbi:MAG: segregation/condensation protein A, partial [Deltaproteobacteria bacterium]|nr:segregation/condensation protein A [Deltaproteobacteria bacterium]
MSTSVKLEVFEGPLDLLLHLIKKNEVSITDIPIATITEQYLATLDLMQTLNLDVAGEFLVMAATLIHIKSRMLLPAGEEEEGEGEEGEDPREQLVRQLLEYQRFK